LKSLIYFFLVYIFYSSVQLKSSYRIFNVIVFSRIVYFIYSVLFNNASFPFPTWILHILRKITTFIRENFNFNFIPLLNMQYFHNYIDYAPFTSEPPDSPPPPAKNAKINNEEVRTEIKTKENGRGTCRRLFGVIQK